MQIPEEDQKKYVILKREDDILREPIRNIKKIHPYCLDFNAEFSAYLPEKIQLQLVPQQLVYISETAMVQFSEKFFEENIQNAAKNMDQEYPVDYVFHYDDGSIKIRAVNENLYDKLMIVYSRKKSAQDEIDKLNIIRSKKDEEQWKKDDKIYVKYLSAILAVSIGTIRSLWPDLLLDKKGNRIQYFGVLRKLEECAVFDAPNNEIIEPFGSFIDGKLHLDSLPLLYDRITLFQACGFISKKKSPELIEQVDKTSRSNGLYFDLSINENSPMHRYTKYDIDMLNKDPEIIKERDKLFARMGLTYEPEKHKLLF